MLNSLNTILGAFSALVNSKAQHLSTKIKNRPQIRGRNLAKLYLTLESRLPRREHILKKIRPQMAVIPTTPTVATSFGATTMRPVIQAAIFSRAASELRTSTSTVNLWAKSCHRCNRELYRQTIEMDQQILQDLSSPFSNSQVNSTPYNKTSHRAIPRLMRSKIGEESENHSERSW